MSNIPYQSTSAAGGPNFSIGAYFSQGWNIFKQYGGAFVGFIFLFWIAGMVIGIIPFGSLIFSLFLSPILTAGILLVADKIRYNETPTFNDFFEGFKGDFWQLVLANLLVLVISVVVIVPALIPFFVGLASLIGTGALAEEEIITNPGAFFAAFGMLAWIGFLLALIIGILVSIFLSFTLHYVLFKKIDAVEGIKASYNMVKANLGSYLGLAIVLYFFNVAGAIFLGVGLLITIPTTYCIWYIAFDDAAGSRELSDENADSTIDHLITE